MKNWKKIALIAGGVLVLLAIVMYVVLRYSSVVLFAMALTYMFSGIWARAAYSWSRRRRWRLSGAPLPDPAAAEPEHINRG